MNRLSSFRRRLPPLFSPVRHRCQIRFPLPFGV
nr:MAG TPA: hypothetical protein [Caudoviricetes sp.]